MSNNDSDSFNSMDNRNNSLNNDDGSYSINNSFYDNFEFFLISTNDTKLMTSESHDYFGNDKTIFYYKCWRNCIYYLR